MITISEYYLMIHYPILMKLSNTSLKKYPKPWNSDSSKHKWQNLKTKTMKEKWNTNSLESSIVSLESQELERNMDRLLSPQKQLRRFNSLPCLCTEHSFLNWGVNLMGHLEMPPFSWISYNPVINSEIELLKTGITTNLYFN